MTDHHPWNAHIDLRDRPTLRDPLESLCEPGVRINVIHLYGLQQRGDVRPGPVAAMAAREECIFLRLFADGSLGASFDQWCSRPAGAVLESPIGDQETPRL